MPTKYSPDGFNEQGSFPEHDGTCYEGGEVSNVNLAQLAAVRKAIQTENRTFFAQVFHEMQNVDFGTTASADAGAFQDRPSGTYLKGTSIAAESANDLSGFAC